MSYVDDNFSDRDSPFEDIRGRVYGYVPVQGEGEVDGLPWYFRARYNSWSFAINEDPDGDPINIRWGVPHDSGWYFQEDYGDDPYSAGVMPYKEAWQFIRQSVDKYRKGEGYIERKKK